MKEKREERKSGRCRQESKRKSMNDRGREDRESERKNGMLGFHSLYFFG